MKARRVLKSVLAVCAAFSSSAAFACPGCKNALATESAMALARGYYWSIIVMLSLPFILTGFVSFLIYRATRKKKRNLLAAPS